MLAQICMEKAQGILCQMSHDRMSEMARPECIGLASPNKIAGGESSEIFVRAKWQKIVNHLLRSAKLCCSTARIAYLAMKATQHRATTYEQLTA